MLQKCMNVRRQYYISISNPDITKVTYWHDRMLQVMFPSNLYQNIFVIKKKRWSFWEKKSKFEILFKQFRKQNSEICFKKCWYFCWCFPIFIFAGMKKLEESIVRISLVLYFRIYCLNTMNMFSIFLFL